MTFIRNILFYIVLLGVIVTLHELGHLLAAKAFGVYCKEFSFGFGPKILSHQGKETEYCLRAIPLGGFVAMAGDTDNDLETKVDIEGLPPERTLPGIAKWKRIIIMLGGIMMNFILAITIYSLLILHSGYYVESTKPVINYVQEASPAEKAGLQAGDIISKVEFDNGLYINPDTYLEMLNFLEAYDGNGPWIISVSRGNEDITYDVYPEYVDDSSRYMIGIGFSNQAIETVKVNILNCWKYGFEYSMFVLKLTFSSLMSLFKGKNLDSLSGPIGIYTTVSETVELGFDYYLQLMAMISINVGLINALPLPIFDGGRVLLLMIEAIIRKPLNEKAQNAVMLASMAVLILLFMLVMYNDISRLIGG
ncbi:MAG: RIP metalloprotease RseP [Erysipelotrichaceae bacterium]|nr:RIP metalloprotease RseP [Erysipelotrichaceae bacterium]